MTLKVKTEGNDSLIVECISLSPELTYVMNPT